MALLSTRRLMSAPWVQRAAGVAAAEYLRLVWNTNRFQLEPSDIYDWIDREMPIILAMWHGQHFLVPFIRRPHHRAKVLISRHRDGEINAVAAERLGVGTVRGSGTHGSDVVKKGGFSAFMEMREALDQGYNVALTADVPKVSRVCGLGIIKLASMSGRPILPIALATSRTAISLPFGRSAGVAGASIHVPADASDAMLESARQAVEAGLNAVTDRAYEIVDRRGAADRG